MNNVIMVELFNLDGSRTDADNSVSMNVWNVTVPTTASQIFTTTDLIFIDAGVWAYLSSITDTAEKTYLFVFENHEDIDGQDNMKVVGIIGPQPDKDNKWVLLTAGGVTYGIAETHGDNMKLTLANGKEIIIKRK